jgi:hypothetical protein
MVGRVVGVSLGVGYRLAAGEKREAVLGVFHVAS